MKPFKHVVFLCLLVVILAQFVVTILHNSTFLFSAGYEKQYTQYKNIYGASQYVRRKNPIIIQDYVFRSYAGGAFLKGLDPILITHDHPPLGNYIIAVSIFLFDNPRTLMVPLLALTLLGVYLISRKAIKNAIFALFPVAIFANEPIFLNKITHAPLIEPIQFPFILFAFYFFLKALEGKRSIKWFILTSLFLGIVISTRFFVTGAVMLFVMLIFMVYKNTFDRKFFIFIVMLPLALVVLVLSYTKTIQDGATILHVFGIQKYILSYHKSKFILPFTFWDLLLFNRWHTWWGNWSISSDPQWTLFWPIASITTACLAIAAFLKKIKVNNTESMLLLWLIIYTITLSVGYSSTNYFLPILPFMYILAASFFFKIFVILRKHYRKMSQNIASFPLLRLRW